MYENYISMPGSGRYRIGRDRFFEVAPGRRARRLKAGSFRREAQDAGDGFEADVGNKP